MEHPKTPRPNSMLLLLKAVLGLVVGAVVGAVAAVVVAGFWFFFIYPKYHHVNWDNPGLGAVPLLAAPFGGIVGAALGTVMAVRRR